MSEDFTLVKDGEGGELDGVGSVKAVYEKTVGSVEIVKIRLNLEAQEPRSKDVC
jgi:hypothetical protein